MPLTLILGPMKSGKSLELIARIAPYEFAEKKVLFVQPAKNVRDEGVVSRSGLTAKSLKVGTLHDVKTDADVIGIDEAFMFDPAEMIVIDQWSAAGKEVIVSSLDLDYSGSLIEAVRQLLQQKPETIIYKKAVCDECKNYDAVYTQILHEGSAITGGLPSVVPEDGTYVYQTRCRTCFVKKG